LIEQARRGIDRLTPVKALRAQREGALIGIADIRPIEQWQRDGDIAGALVIDRNLLEWRLAPRRGGGWPDS